VQASLHQVTRSNADLAQFAYVASHDLQEPLRAVGGCVQLLKRRYTGKLDQKADELIQMIVDGSARMKALIDDLLAYSQTGGDERLQVIDTGEALQEALANLDSAVRESSAEIDCKTLPPLRFVKTEFVQVLQNLIGNAIKYRGLAAPLVHVRAERQGDAWVFRVADNGIGFEPQYAEQIFGVFKRLHTREKYAGTGIGLALVKKLVERRGGWIWVDSVPDQGSTFYFSVPDADASWETTPE
ncbi:MAG TPA: ATP-binding protein, partial [Chthoniobacterales bacterium]